MNCLNCSQELLLIKGKEAKLFCSDACRKAHNRKAYNQHRTTSDISTSDKQEKPTSDIYPPSDKDWIGCDGKYHNWNEWQVLLKNYHEQGMSENEILAIAGV
jgi:hypothetical protein